MRSISLKFNTGQYTVDECCMTCIEIENNNIVKLQLAASACVNFINC